MLVSIIHRIHGEIQHNGLEVFQLITEWTPWSHHFSGAFCAAEFQSLDFTPEEISVVKHPARAAGPPLPLPNRKVLTANQAPMSYSCIWAGSQATLLPHPTPPLPLENPGV